MRLASISSPKTVVPGRPIIVANAVVGALLITVGLLHLAVMAAHPFWADRLRRGL